MVPKCRFVCTLTVSSPIGDIKIQSCNAGLHSVKQWAPDDSTFNPDERYLKYHFKKGDPLHSLGGLWLSRVCVVQVKSQLPKTGDPEASDYSHQCVQWLQDYFMHGIARTDIPPLCPTLISKASFRTRVWSLLPEAAPFGTKITYGQLADLCGNKQASRAAGQAMANNPLSLLIPCHRVIPSHGGIGNYHHGKKNLIKAWLLQYEETQNQT